MIRQGGRPALVGDVRAVGNPMEPPLGQRALLLGRVHVVPAHSPAAHAVRGGRGAARLGPAPVHARLGELVVVGEAAVERAAGVTAPSAHHGGDGPALREHVVRHLLEEGGATHNL